ncbi:MAG: protoporphyrinogen oxidase [Actinobacteria bacterium]|nr:protoporphyrinogen oxidase [Actinomycetota bacterium]MCG2808331.1 protoporphyrinogen oxidase [Coriobacteriia bacterium]
MKKIIIIGGGIAGLGAAYKVHRAAQADHDITFQLFEKSERLGGKLATDRIPDPETGEEFIVDGGSDSFLTEKTPVHRVARLLGIFEDESPTSDEFKKTLIVKRGRLVELPDGIMMFAPTKILPMATTSLYSWPAKLRMALDLILPRKKVPAGQLNDESLEGFVVRRLGREALDRLAEPLVGGVNGSDPALMSLAATYPSLLAMEQEHGSLVRGFLAQRKKVEAIKKKYPPKPGAKPRTFFSSFYGGMQYLTDRMADEAGRDSMRTGVGATHITRESDGTWTVELDTGEKVTGDAVIVATEIWAAEELLRGVDASMAELLSQIPSSSSTTVPIAFREEDCPFDKHWHGILSPRIEHMAVTGVSLVSSKWPGKTPAGRVLLRAFVGGPHNQDVLTRSDDEIIETVRTALVELLGVRAEAEPLFARVYRWDKGMPQYTLGHLDRAAAIESRVESMAGLGLAGGGLRGVGVPNCLDSGEKAVTKVLSEWGMTLAEDSADERRLY